MCDDDYVIGLYVPCGYKSLVFLVMHPVLSHDMELFSGCIRNTSSNIIILKIRKPKSVGGSR